ncbi:hypothetical protein FRC12_008955, partial [Ceratobasidium sp. 428]
MYWDLLEPQNLSSELSLASMAAKGQLPPIYIGVFGGPRVGKSSFIREVVNNNHARLNLPPTKDVRVGKPITIDGRQVVFVDTPAFYNRTIRDADSADVLKRLAGFFGRLQQNGRHLNAAIFIHPKSARPNAPWLLEEAQRNWSIFCQLVGETFSRNVVFVSTGWSNPPTQEQVARENQIKSQEPFRSLVPRVNWASGPAARSAFDIVRVAMRNSPRQMAIQHELADRKLRLADTSVGKAVIGNSKQTAQQLRARGNAQGAQRADIIQGKLQAGYQQEATRWPVRPRRPARASGPAPGRPQAANRPAHRPPAPAATRPGQRQSAPVSRPNSFAQGDKRPVRQQGPVATPPMAYQPGRGKSNIQMQQIQPTARPPMNATRGSHSHSHSHTSSHAHSHSHSHPAPVHHHHTTHVHAPPNPHQPPPSQNIQYNSVYSNYSYEQNVTLPPPPTRTPTPPRSSSYGGLAVGAGLVGGAALGYVAYETLDEYDDSYPDDDQWVEDDDDLYADNTEDPSAYTYDDFSDDMGSYDNDPSAAYPDDTGDTWVDQTPEPDYGTSNLADSSPPIVDSSGDRDYSGGGGNYTSGGDSGGDGDCCDCDNC